jgi:hypothetical protein
LELKSNILKEFFRYFNVFGLKMNTREWVLVLPFAKGLLNGIMEKYGLNQSLEKDPISFSQFPYHALIKRIAKSRAVKISQTTAPQLNLPYA